MSDVELLQSLLAPKKKGKKGDSAAELFNNAGLSSLRGNFAVRTSSNESFTDLLDRINSVQRSTDLLEVLGKKPKDKKREGLLTKLLGQEKGILTAPARAVSAFAADVFGIPFDDPTAREALDKYDPLEAAFRSAKGEFAITGGDIFRVQDDDNFATRLAKWGGALAFDIATDPISYVGTIGGPLSRKSIAVLAVRDGEKMLTPMSKVLANNGIDSVKVVDRLFQSSPAGQLFELGDSRVVSKLTDATGNILTNQKTMIAGKQFGSLLGANLYRHGRSGVIRGAADLFAIEGVSREVAEKAAKEFVESLPKELGSETGRLLAGGIYLKTPFTGKPIAKLKSAKLEPTVVGNLANEAFFRASASSGGQWVSRNFQGKFGRAWAETKKAMIPGIPVKTPLDADSLYKYVDFKDAMEAMGREVRTLTNIENAVASSAQAIRHGITDPEKAAYYDKQLTYYFNQPLAPMSVNTELQATLTAGSQKQWSQAELEELDTAAKMAADALHQHMNTARQRKIDAGFEVGNLGPGWVPLMFKDEVYEALRVSGSLKGPDELRYAPGRGRIQEVEVITNDELSKLKGYRIDKDVTALSAQAANAEIGTVKIGGKEFDGLYEEDPTKLALKYMHEVHNAVTSKRLVDALELTGTIAVLPRKVQEVLNDSRAALFVASLTSKQGITPAIAKRAEEALANTEKQLKDLVDQEEVAAVTRQVMQRIKDAEDNIAAIDEEIATATANLRAARQAARQARPSVPSAQRVLQEYGQSGIEQTVEEAQRIARNAASRTSKATKKAEEAAAQAASTQARANQPIFDPTTFKYTDASVARAVLPEMQDAAIAAQEKAAVEIVTLAGARNELEFAKQLRQDILNELGPAQVQRFDLFQEALELQVRAAQELDALRIARRDAVRELTAANADTTLQRAGVLQGVVRLYVRYRRELFETVAQTGRRVKDMTDEERIAFETAKGLHDRARKLLFSVLEHSTRKTTKGAGREYARKVIDMAERLSADQFELAQVIADSKALQQMADSLDGVRLSDQMQIVGDMVQSYKTIRDKVTPEELSELGLKKALVLEQVGGSGRSALTRKELRSSELAKQLYVEDNFMQLGAKGGARIPASMVDVWTTKGIRGVLEDIYRLHSQPTEWERFISRIYDPAALVWRVATTVGRGPAFVFTNTVGGHANNYLGGVTVAEHALSAKMLATSVAAVRKIEKQNPNLFPDEIIERVAKELESKLGNIKIGDKTVTELWIEFFERGGHFDTDTFFHREQLAKTGLATAKPKRLIGNITAQFSDEPVGKAENVYRRVVKFMLDNRVQAAFSDLAQASEVYLRFAAFLSGYRRFQNLNSAMDLTYMLHFNYADLAGAEVWVKRFIPFYTWARNNVPLQIRASFLASSKMANLVKANEEFRTAMAADEDAQWMNDYLPDWMQIQNGFVSYFTFGGNHLGMFNKLPMADLDRMFEVRYIGSVPFPVPRTDEFVNMLGPAGKTAIEWMTNRNFTFGYEYESIGDKVWQTVQNTVPYVGTGKRLASAVGFDVDRERRMSNLFGILAGAPYGLTTITEKTINGAAFNRQMALSAEVKRAAAEAGVDVEWLQKRIKAGDSLLTLAMKVSAGQGNAATISLGKQLKEYTDRIEGKTKKQDKDYRAIVGALRSS